VKTLLFAVSAIVFLGTDCSAMGNRDLSSGQGQTEMKSRHGMMGSMMMNMDTNGDGMLSKEEFMKGHDTMFDRMKGPNGMISLKDMQMKGMGMMGHGSMTDQSGATGTGQSMPGMNQGPK